MSAAAHIPPGMLLRVINDKQDVISHYGHLLTLAGDSRIIGIIREILMEEEVHLELFKNLYSALFSERCEPVPDAPPWNDSFIDGIRRSIIKEAETYSFYGNIYFSDPNEMVRDAFLRALFDENIHSTKFSYIFSLLLENGGLY